MLILIPFIFSCFLTNCVVLAIGGGITSTVGDFLIDSEYDENESQEGITRPSPATLDAELDEFYYMMVPDREEASPQEPSSSTDKPQENFRL